MVKPVLLGSQSVQLKWHWMQSQSIYFFSESKVGRPIKQKSLVGRNEWLKDLQLQMARDNKGQEISEGNCGVFSFTKKNRNISPISALTSKKT